MESSEDPFRHHPELRERIADPLQCFYRTLTTAFMAQTAEKLGVPQWWHSDEKREALRARFLAELEPGDLWVFAYGSLMWDPGLRFAEVRRAWVPDYVRRFIVKDIYGARGTREAPGIIAALDAGEGCHGLLFRIAEDHIDEETEVLWRREQLGPTYRAVFVEAAVEEQPITALTFVADHEAELIDAGMTREEQIHYIATGAGFAGTSIDYLRNIHGKFQALGIRDDEVETLLGEVEAYISTL